MIIESSYSPLNNYNYKGKPFLSSALDWLSTPCRRVLGGRNICVLSQTYTDKMSTVAKVATVFFSVLITPVAVISIVSLIAKLITCPWVWEKKRIKVQSQEQWKIINQFNQACEKSGHDEAIQIFKQNPNLGKRSDIYNNFFKSINWKINNHSSWEEVQTALSFLNVNEAIELINHAIKTKLSHEFKNERNTTSADHIIHFIRNSLGHPTTINIEACYKRLFSDALQVDTNENMVLNAIRMDISDHMIRSLVQTKALEAENELARTHVQLEESLLRHSLFKKEQNYLEYNLIFNSTDNMQKVSALIQSIRNVSQLGWQSLDKLNALSTQGSANQQEQWENIRSELVKFGTSLDQLKVSSDEGDKVYIQSMQAIFEDMVTFIDSIRKASSVEEIESCSKNVQTSLAEQVTGVKNLFNDTEISSSQTYSDNLLSTLRLKKKADLFTFTQKMTPVLTTNMCQAATSMLS